MPDGAVADQNNTQDQVDAHALDGAEAWIEANKKRMYRATV